jgi:lysophospholipase L1-like esterase
MNNRSPERLMGLAIGAAVTVLVAALVVGFGVGAFDTPATPLPPATELADVTPSSVATATSAPPTATPTPSPTPTFTPFPTPTPTIARPLPTMLATIGDSYTQAWSTSPKYRRDHPMFSWAVGYAKKDGVFSLRERFEALGAKLVIANEATSGRKMDDASRQAGIIAQQASTLPAGSTVYVTFELGTNDLCDFSPTPLDNFEADLRDATNVLENLPSGSRILMLSVPDFSHFRAITQANSRARAYLATSAGSLDCPPFLGKGGHYTLAQARATLAGYNAVLYKVCDEIQANDGNIGKLYCSHNEAALSERDFTVADLSTADYFHPSISGQAKMAAAAWNAGFWGSLPIPPGAAS